MAGPVSYRMDTREFDATLNRYRKFSKRDPKTICDTKAFFIARQAVLETPKAQRRIIREGLKEKVDIGDRSVPLAALIINARRGRAGRPGLYGRSMRDAIKGMLAARLRSVAYLKSGWVPAIKALFRLAEKRGAPRQERGLKQFGRPKGFAKPSSSSARAKTTIGNEAWTTHDKKMALHKYGGPALQRAFNHERRSMLQYIEDKLKRSAHQAGIRTA